LTDQTTSALGIRITIALALGAGTSYAAELSTAVTAAFTAAALANSITAVVGLIADLTRSTRIAAVGATSARAGIGTIAVQTIVTRIRVESIFTGSIVAAIVGTHIEIMTIAVVLTGTAGGGYVIIEAVQPLFQGGIAVLIGIIVGIGWR
jgi:hypothetical protein